MPGSSAKMKHFVTFTPLQSVTEICTDPCKRAVQEQKFVRAKICPDLTSICLKPFSRLLQIKRIALGLDTSYNGVMTIQSKQYKLSHKTI